MGVELSGKTYKHLNSASCVASVAQAVEHWPCKLMVMGSSPALVYI